LPKIGAFFDGGKKSIWGLYMEEVGEMYEIWIIDPNHSKPSAHPKDPFFNS